MKEQPQQSSDQDDGFYHTKNQKVEKVEKQELENSTTKKENANSKTKKIKKKVKKEKIKKNIKDENKKAKSKLDEKVEVVAERVITEMKQCFDKDLISIKKQRPALKKVKYLEELNRTLANIYVSQKFLDLGGLEEIERWFSSKFDDSSYVPSLVIRKGMMELLFNLKIKDDHINKMEELQREILKHKKSQVAELRNLSFQIMKKWKKLSYDQFLNR